jgi:hypothetical protein
MDEDIEEIKLNAEEQLVFEECKVKLIEACEREYDRWMFNTFFPCRSPEDYKSLMEKYPH